MPIDVQDAETLKAKFKLARQKEIHFAFGASTAPEKNVFVLHDKLSGERLAKEVRTADKAGKLNIGTRISFGTARLDGTELVLTTEAPVSKMRKGVRGCLKTSSITVQAVRLRAVDGTEFPEDEEEDGVETAGRGPLGLDAQDGSVEDGSVEDGSVEDDLAEDDLAEGEPSAERLRERFEAVKPVLQAAARADKDLAGELSGRFKAYSAALARGAWEECEAALAAMDAAAGPALRRRIEEDHVGPHLERVAKDSPTAARKHRQTIDGILARAEEGGRLGAILAGFEEGALGVDDLTGGLKGGMWAARNAGKVKRFPKPSGGTMQQRRDLHLRPDGTYGQFEFPKETPPKDKAPNWTRGYEVPGMTEGEYKKQQRFWNFDIPKNFHGVGLDDIIALATNKDVELNSDPEKYSPSAVVTTHGNIDFTKGKVNFEMPRRALEEFSSELGLAEVEPTEGEISKVGAKDFAKIYANFLKNVGAAEKITQVRLHACYAGFVGAELLRTMREQGLPNLTTLYAPMGRVSTGAQSDASGKRGKKMYVGVPSGKAVSGQASVGSTSETEFVFPEGSEYGLDDLVEKEDPPQHPLIRGFHLDPKTGEVVADELPERFRYLDRADMKA